MKMRLHIKPARRIREKEPAERLFRDGSVSTAAVLAPVLLLPIVIKGERPGTGAESQAAWSIDTEKKAIQDARAGDPHAFGMLYENYSEFVYRRCLRLTHDPVIAEDLSQDVFVQVWRKIATFRGSSSLKTWLHRVATNVVFMHLRKNRRRASQVQYDSCALGERSLEESFSSPPSRLDDRMLLSQTVSVLPPGHRAVLMLHDVDGYKHEEIARILGIPSGTSKSNLHRARRQIRTVFERRQTRPFTMQQEVA